MRLRYLLSVDYDVEDDIYPGAETEEAFCEAEAEILSRAYDNPLERVQGLFAEPGALVQEQVVPSRAYPEIEGQMVIQYE